MKQEKPIYALFLGKNDVTHSNNGGDNYARLEIRVVVIEEGHKVRNGCNVPLCDLHFSCYWNDRDNDHQPYGWTMDYRNLYSVGKARAEEMVQTFRKAAKAKVFPVRPQTFGQYCVLMARAIGVTKFAQCYEDSPTGSYSDMDIRISELNADAQGAIDWAVSEDWRKTHPKPAEQEAVSA